jgi:hypothetical protein
VLSFVLKGLFGRRPPRGPYLLYLSGVYCFFKGIDEHFAVASPKKVSKERGLLSQSYLLFFKGIDERFAVPKAFLRTGTVWLNWLPLRFSIFAGQFLTPAASYAVGKEILFLFPLVIFYIKRLEFKRSGRLRRTLCFGN